MAAEFRGRVACFTPDRVGDTIRSHAFDESIAEWQMSGAEIPLRLEHKHDIGTVDPASLTVDREGLVASGKIDTSTAAGVAAWRELKDGRAAFSIKFRAATHPRHGGGRVIDELALEEVSVTGRPAHPGTRLLPRVRRYDPQRERAEEFDREFAPICVTAFAA